MDRSKPTSSGVSPSGSSGPRHPQGRWGSACAACSVAKARARHNLYILLVDCSSTSFLTRHAVQAKCIRSNATPGSPCDRCKRLARECTGQVHLPRKKRTAKNTRTSQLEERLDGLVDLLRASQEIPAKASSSQPPRDSTSSDPPPSASRSGESTISVPSTWNSSCPPRCVCASSHGVVTLPTTSDEMVLSLYQTQLVPSFPFVPIPPGTQARQFKIERPFLFAAMRMALCISDQRAMHAQMYQLMHDLTQEILIASVRSMDLLQALLVMLAWFQNHCVAHAQLNNLVHLAQAHLADMNLNSEPEIQERVSVMVLSLPKLRPRRIEEKRAALGVWFITSSVSVALQKIPSMEFSKYLQRCLRDIETSPECDSDLFLVHLVRAHRLMEQIHNWASQKDDGDHVTCLPRASDEAYRGVFSAELQRQRNSLPSSLKYNKWLEAYFAAIKARLFPPPPVEAPVLRQLSESLSTYNPGTVSALDIFHAAKVALEGFFDSLFDVPNELWPTMPMFLFFHLVFAATMLARWAKVLGPGRSSESPSSHRSMPADILTRHKVIWDPSARREYSRSTFGHGLAPVPSFDTDEASNTTKDTTPEAGPALHSAGARRTSVPFIPPPITDPTQISPVHIPETADPTIPRIIATLKTQLLGQTGLDLDIIGILARLAQRSDQAHKTIMSMGADGAWQNDVWYFCAKKILITRAKLEKWAEIVAAGGVVAAEQQQPRPNSTAKTVPVQESTTSSDMTEDHSGNMGPIQQGKSWLEDDASLAAFQKELNSAAMGALPPDATYDYSLYESGNSWTDSIFDPLDPSLWFQAGGDWGAALLGPSQDTQMDF